jgi:hypothetical protein
MALNNFDTNISWSQFKKLSARPVGQNEDAQIHSEISFSNFKLAKKGSAITITDVDINIQLVPVDCWVVADQMSADLLKHEQGHYDILALNAREIQKELLKVTAASTQKLQAKVNDLQTKASQRVKTMDDRYDSATDHSRKKDIQQIWDRKIDTAKKNPNGTLDYLPQ